MTIRRKLLLLFLLVAVVPMAFVGVRSYRNSVRAVESVMEGRTLSVVDGIALGVIGLYQPRKSEVKLLTRSRPIQDLYARYADIGAEAFELTRGQIEAYFQRFFTGPQELFTRVAFLNLQGELIFSYARRPDTGGSTGWYSFATQDPTLPKVDLRAHEHEDGLFLSNQYNPTYGSILRLGRWVNDVEGGTRVGFIVAEIEVARFLREAGLADADLGEDQLALIVGRDQGRLVFHPEKSLVGIPVEDALSDFARLYDEIRFNEGSKRWDDQGKPLTTIQTVNVDRPSENWWHWYEDDEGEALATYVNLDAPSWTIALLSRASKATETVRSTAILNLAITFGVLLVVLIVFSLVIGRVTASIRLVAEGAEAIASGDLDQQITVRTHDETRQLADSFNRMSRSLKTTMGDLRQLTEELEERVQSRTSELEQANEQIQQVNVQLQEASSHKSDFLARMSHDLRTPMNAIIGYTRILLRRSKDILDDRQYQNLENIQTSAGNLLALINDILDLSKIEAGRMDVNLKQVDVKQIVEDCARSIETLLKPGVSLVQNSDGASAIQTDPDRLRSVVMNLLSNAVKFTEAGTITVTLQDANGGQRLSVADTGVGIAAGDLPRVFEEFRQLEQRPGQQQGSGLGLAIAQKTVELLGGTISVESELGRGTTFTVELPR